MSIDVHFSAEREDWATPPDLFAKLDAEFGFTLDSCAFPHNAKVSRYYTPEDDGLAQPWTGVVWCNPPYGKQIKNWMRKGYESSRHGATVVMLVPSRTDAGWWHDYAMKGEVRFVRGRIKFVGAKFNAPFPSAIVVFRPPTILTA